MDSIIIRGFLFGYTFLVVSSFLYDYSFMSAYIQWGPLIILSFIITGGALYNKFKRTPDTKKSESKFDEFIVKYSNNYTFFIYTFLISTIMYLLKGEPKHNLLDISSAGFWVAWPAFIILTAVYCGKD